MKIKYPSTIISGLLTFSLYLTACGPEAKSPKRTQHTLPGHKVKNQKSESLNVTRMPQLPPQSTWDRTVELTDKVTLVPPSGFNPNTHLSIDFFRWNTPPKSTGDFTHSPRQMTDEEGRALFFNGLLPLVLEANRPDPTSSEFGRAISEGMIVGPACATTNSQVLEYAAKKAGLDWIIPLFSDPWSYLPTHNNEYQFMLLGWHYYLMDDYISPAGSIGAWTRYTFYGIPDHTGHIYITFEDRGPDSSPLVGDNTRRNDELHGHPYRPAGRPVGFWMPPGVYPVRR